ncbi:MAG: aminopeptidase P family N-terminal domain-containing protein, partial [Acidobacteriia bacterium]|nr:aminopeptidase P family N-terminal domain-containing protein [Terriglobia bacterium]
MSTPPLTNSRRQKALLLLAERKLDALVVSSPASIRYLSGFTGSNGLLLLTPKRSWIFTDPRYAIQVAQESDCTPKVVRSGALMPKLAPHLPKGPVGYDPAHMTVEAFHILTGILPRNATLKPAPGLVETLRSIKSPDEIERIRASVLLNSKAFQNAIQL